MLSANQNAEIIVGREGEIVEKQSGGNKCHGHLFKVISFEFGFFDF